MRKILQALSLIAIAIFPVCLQAATDEENRVIDSSEVIEQLLSIPEQSIPPALLSNASAVAIIPHVVKVGFGLGARRGKGLIVVRQQDGTWSNPAFITLTGGSIGLQIGAQSTDIILVFKSRKSVDGIANGKLTLGADASIAAGPVGRQAAIATDLTLKSEVYSYSRSRGLFAGVALEGAGVSMDRKANAAYYGSAKITADQIFNSSGNAAPAGANRLVQILTIQTNRLPAGQGMASENQTLPATAPQTENTPSEVRTYGIPPVDEGRPD